MGGWVVNGSSWTHRANPRDQDIALTAAASYSCGEDLILRAFDALIIGNISSVGQARSSREALVAVEANTAQRIGLIEIEVGILKLGTRVCDAHYSSKREVTLNCCSCEGIDEGSAELSDV